LATKTIEKVEFYVENELAATMTEAPYIVQYEVPSSMSSGWKSTKAVVTATDGTTFERYGRFSVVSGTTKREPFGDVPVLPATIKIEEYDKGTSGITSYNTTRTSATQAKAGQWMDYTVDVKEDGLYSFDATVASAVSGGRFHVAEYGLDSLSFLTEFVEIPKTGGNSQWKTLHGNIMSELKAGRHVFTLLIDKGNFNIKDITFNRIEEAEGSCLLKVSAGPYGVGDVVKVTARPKLSSTLSEVRFYADNLLIGTATASPYECVFTPTEMRKYTITAVAVDTDGKEKLSPAREVEVTINTAIRSVVSDERETPVYNVMGQPVGDNYRGIVIKNGKKFVIK
jgi:hypothetical protein